jgi:hypothetical protein
MWKTHHNFVLMSTVIYVDGIFFNHSINCSLSFSLAPKARTFPPGGSYGRCRATATIKQSDKLKFALQNTEKPAPVGAGFIHINIFSTAGLPLPPG